VPAPRRNDPSGVSDNPQVVTDEARLAELVDEFKRRLAYVAHSYGMAVRILRSDRDFNASLDNLERSLARKRLGTWQEDRAHFEIELVINEFARQHARERSGEVDPVITQEDADAAARKASEVLKMRRRPANRHLRHHVEGLMALIQEIMGTPVLMTLTKKSLYAPHASNIGGRLLLSFFQSTDPSIATITIADMVNGARRKYAGKPMRFVDFFPLYGAQGDLLSGGIQSGSGIRIEGFQPNIPIYFP
jgi:hypothetical protein